MTIKGISHIHICVANVGKSLEFYRDILGLTVKTHTQQMLDLPGAKPLGMYSRLSTSRTVADIYFDDAESPQPVLALTSHPGQVDGNPIKFDEKGITNIAFQVDNIESHARMLSDRRVTVAEYF
jgi:catechol 2,3-dioxygenase-like lactoylglutathione lyase family enzyme